MCLQDLEWVRKMPFDLANIRLSEMTLLGSTLRTIGLGAQSIEEVGQRVVGCLYNDFIDPTDRVRANVLVRFYLTVPYCELDSDLKAFAARLIDEHELLPTTPCLTLLATAGDKDEWNSRKLSKGHQTIPLPSAAVVQAIPMVSQLITQLGLDLGTLLSADRSLLLEAEQRTYNVFFVPRALGSLYIPAQADFVAPNNVQSVVGFGGLLPTGEVYAVLMFTRVPVSRSAADIFRNAAMNLKVALLPFAGRATFQP